MESFYPEISVQSDQTGPEPTGSIDPTSEGGSTIATMRSGIHDEPAYSTGDAIKPYCFTFERVMMTLDGVEGTGWHSEYFKYLDDQQLLKEEIWSFDVRTLDGVMALVKQSDKILPDHKKPICKRLEEVGNS